MHTKAGSIGTATQVERQYYTDAKTSPAEIKQQLGGTLLLT